MNLLLPEIMNFEKSLKDAKKMKKKNEIAEAGLKYSFLKKKYQIKNFSFLLHLLQALFFIIQLYI